MIGLLICSSRNFIVYILQYPASEVQLSSAAHGGIKGKGAGPLCFPVRPASTTVHVVISFVGSAMDI